MRSANSIPVDPSQLVADCVNIARKRGFRVERFGSRDGVPLVAVVRRGLAGRPNLYLSAGTHGDEPAPPLAIRRMLEADAFHDSVNWFIVPVLNPSGLRLGQRESRDGIDLNWDYRQPVSREITAHTRWLAKQPRFDLALCLHEDWEASGFYLYDHDPADRPDLVHAILEAAGTHVPIAWETVIDGWHVAETGVIRPWIQTAIPTWPEAVFLRQHRARQCYTTETPSALAPDARIAAIAALVQAAAADAVVRSQMQRRLGAESGELSIGGTVPGAA